MSMLFYSDKINILCRCMSYSREIEIAVDGKRLPDKFWIDDMNDVFVTLRSDINGLDTYDLDTITEIWF